MIRLNRTTEYGLIALRHMEAKSHKSPNEVTSAREIARAYGLPFEFTAKTLQKLKELKIIHSAQGSRGGYKLGMQLSEISFVDFLDMMEGTQRLTDCCPGKAATSYSSDDGKDRKYYQTIVGEESRLPCEFFNLCTIQGFMVEVNSRIRNLLQDVKLDQLSADHFLGMGKAILENKIGSQNANTYS